MFHFKLHGDLSTYIFNKYDYLLIKMHDYDMPSLIILQIRKFIMQCII